MVAWLFRISAEVGFIRSCCLVGSLLLDGGSYEVGWCEGGIVVVLRDEVDGSVRSIRGGSASGMLDDDGWGMLLGIQFGFSGR